jgi:hypothetical protein
MKGNHCTFAPQERKVPLKVELKKAEEIDHIEMGMDSKAIKNQYSHDKNIF